MNQYIVGTDIACIGIWDTQWSDPNIREQSTAKFFKRLPRDAEKKQLFYIETGGDGEASVHVYLEEDFSDEDYTLISDEFFIHTTSGTCIIDGVEWYGNSYTGGNLLTIAPGTYRVTLYILNDHEREASEMTQEGATLPQTPLEKIWMVGAVAGMVSLYLLFTGRYLAGGTLFAIAAIYAHFLGKAQEYRKVHDTRRVTVHVTKPYLVLVLSRVGDAGQKGGYISIAGRRTTTD